MEVKKLLQARNVRKTIADTIINRIFSTSDDSVAPDAMTSGEEVSRSEAATPSMNEEIDVVHVSRSLTFAETRLQMAEISRMNLR